MRLTIGYLYSTGMNVYGDRGNVMALVQRCRWRGIDVEVVKHSLDENGSFSDFDILFAGGGQDRDQIAVSRDLLGDTGKQLIEAVENDAVVLTICGTYQLLGQYFKTSTGETLPGIGIFDAWTVGGSRRFIGDAIIHAQHGGEEFELVGFENHSGLTYLGPTGSPFGTVMVGSGNNGEDGNEGAVYRNAFGCYLHGPLLPKNPRFADHLIRLAVRRRFGEDIDLEPLDDRIEAGAHDATIDRVRRRGQVHSGVR